MFLNYEKNVKIANLCVEKYFLKAWKDQYVNFKKLWKKDKATVYDPCRFWKYFIAKKKKKK